MYFQTILYSSLPFFLGMANGVVHQKTWDCFSTAESCNNACYAVSCAGKSWRLTLGPQGTDLRNRALSGVDVHPCANVDKYPEVKRQKPANQMTVTDEYPFASSTQGGFGAILRCTTKDDSNVQGSAIRSMWAGVPPGDDIEITLMNVDANSSPFCAPYTTSPTAQPGVECSNHLGYEFKQDPQTVHRGSGVKKQWQSARRRFLDSLRTEDDSSTPENIGFSPA